MTPQQIAAAYDKIADHWDCPEFNFHEGIAQHRRALQFAPEQGLALDVGCGASGRFIELLLKQGFAVEGLDLSSAMLARAKRRHPQLLFHQADICLWQFPQRYDFISAWDSIWHVPLAEQLAVLRKLCDGLNSGGVLIFTTGGVEQADEITNPCFEQPLYHAAPGIPAILHTLSQADCACRHLEFDQYPEKHVYLIAQRLY